MVVQRILAAPVPKFFGKWCDHFGDELLDDVVKTNELEADAITVERVRLLIQYPILSEKGSDAGQLL